MDEIMHETDAPPSPAEREKTWVCGVCGRIDKDRGRLYMKGCGTWAVEVWVDSIKLGANGFASFATAVDAEPAKCSHTWRSAAAPVDGKAHAPHTSCSCVEHTIDGTHVCACGDCFPSPERMAEIEAAKR